MNYFEHTFGLHGHCALVTGAGSGLGLAIARHVGRAGARVVLNDVDTARCNEATAQLRSEGLTVHPCAFDVSDAEAVGRAVDDCLHAGWAVDILVSNAGNQHRRPVAELTDAQWRALFSVHVDGAFHCARSLLPSMRARGFGRIVIVSSVAAFACLPETAGYATAKGALATFARALAVEEGRAGIRANAIAPGFVRTPFTQALQQRDGFDAYLRTAVPMQRWAEPDEIASAVVFLCSPASAFVNGHTLVVDGGLLAQL